MVTATDALTSVAINNTPNVGSSLANITANINQYVVSPIAIFGLAGFVFNAEGEALANMSADITDHYAEDNRAIQDQIAIRPKRITLKGYVGELVYNNPGNSPTVLNTLGQKLTSLTAFLPSLTAAATQVQAAVTNSATVSFSSVLGTSSNIYGIVQNLLGAFGPTQNQQNAYSYFKALLQSATLMAVQTPWEFMTNMAIESVVAIQSESSRWISDFAVTLKEIRIASTATTGPQSNASAQVPNSGLPWQQSNPAILSGAASVQQAPITNTGNNSGAPSPVTLNSSLF